jgi:hypothetical protein
MAAADLLGGVNLNNLGNGAINIFIMLFLLGIFIGACIGVFYWYKYNKRYSAFNVKIWQKDGTGFIHEKYDKAGIFIDKKTNNKRFFLKINKVGLNPDNVPFLPGPGGVKIVYLLQTGLKNFRFIKPNIAEEYVDVKVGEEDVNWGVNSYERAKKLFATSTLMQYLPFLLFIVVVIVIMIIFIYLFKKFDVIKDAALALEHASQNLAAVNSGTTIVRGVGAAAGVPG